MDQRFARVKEMLGLRRLPIKIAFLDALPANLVRYGGGPAPSGCFFWDRAMDGHIFYTLPADHWNCAIGSYTHRIGLPADRASELETTIGFMVETRYLDPAEIPEIPTLEREPAAVAYAPVMCDEFTPDVVLLAVTPAQATLIFEAGLKAGVAKAAAAAFSRPTCATLPMAAKTEMMALSFGCSGNRTFTKVRDEELYISLPGAKWDEILDRIIEVQRSNLTMGNYYQAQRAKFSGSR
jgi:uncharacterized protein (DUF169 family)